MSSAPVGTSATSSWGAASFDKREEFYKHVPIIESRRKPQDICLDIVDGSGDRLIDVKYPNISDYYRSISKDPDNVNRAKKGCSGFSTLVFGDERLQYLSSFSQECFQIDQEKYEKIRADKKVTQKPKKQLKKEYLDAFNYVGPIRVRKMEQDMRAKLQQRTKTGPFQLRRTFKYFDRDGSGGIDFGEFKDALLIMGFEYKDVELLALYGTYDSDLSGEMSYYEFIERLMEQDFKDTGKIRKLHDKSYLDARVDTMLSNKLEDMGLEDDDLDDEEYRSFCKEQFTKIFHMVDKDNSGCISSEELELLCLSLGMTADKTMLRNIMQAVDKDGSGEIDEEEFFHWFMERQINMRNIMADD